MIASMAEGSSSRMAVVLPQGALFRKSAEGKIREALLKEDLIEAVIGMAPNLVLRHRPRGCVVVLRRNKPAERKNKVLIIDAQSLFEKVARRTSSIPNTANKIVSGSRPSKMSKIGQGRQPRRDQGRRLDAQHLPLRPAAHRRRHPALPEAVAAFKDALTEARAAEDHLRTVLTEGGWLND